MAYHLSPLPQGTKVFSSRSTTGSSSSSDIPQDDSEFKPWLVVIGLVVLVAIYMIFQGKKWLEGRLRPRTEDEMSSSDKIEPPRLIDVYVENTAEGHERWAWKEMQLLSLEQTRATGSSRSCPQRTMSRIQSSLSNARDTNGSLGEQIQARGSSSARRDDPEEFRVSVTVSIPSRSPRRRRVVTGAAEAGRTENISELGDRTSDVARKDFDFMIGVSHVLCVRRGLALWDKQKAE